MSELVLIIGAGQAAVQAAHSARQQGYEGRISIVGAEPYAPYQRPPLSKKYLAGAIGRERLELRPASWFKDKGVTLELGVRAVELDAAARTVRLDDGRSMGYDRLLLATGGRPRRLAVPGADLPGIHYVRTIGDVDAITPELVEGRRLVLVGAGYIGLEVASVAVRRGLDVAVLEASDRVMSRVVGPDISRFYHACHTAEGARLHYRTVVSAFTGGARVSAVETAGGDSHPCDLVIVGVGIEPDVELARTAGLPCEDGIIVDPYARTADPRITAAGDCTSHPHWLAGRFIRLESVQNAIEQAKAAASVCAGEPRPYTEVPWFWSDQYDSKLQIAGLAAGYDETVLRGDPESNMFAAFYLRGGELLAVEAVNSPREFMFARKAIAQRLTPARAALADPSSDLTALLAQSGL